MLVCHMLHDLTVGDFLHSAILAGVDVEPFRTASAYTSNKIRKERMKRAYLLGLWSMVDISPSLITRCSLGRSVLANVCPSQQCSHGTSGLYRHSLQRRWCLTVSFEESPIFLPTRSFIHLLVWSLSPLLDVRPGTTRGMFGSWCCVRCEE